MFVVDGGLDHCVVAVAMMRVILRVSGLIVRQGCSSVLAWNRSDWWHDAGPRRSHPYCSLVVDDRGDGSPGVATASCPKEQRAKLG